MRVSSRSGADKRPEPTDEAVEPSPPTRRPNGRPDAHGRTTAARSFGLALVPGTAFMLLFLWRSSSNPYGSRRFTLFDDATISLTYGRTLADTGEAVWFEGADQVQGFTNPLWTLYMSLLHMVGVSGSGVSLAVSMTGVVVILATAWLTYSLVSSSISDDRIAHTCGLIASAAIPLLYPLTFWTLRGMEVGLLAMLVLVMIRGLVIGTEPRLVAIGGAAVILGVLTRLDFAVLAGALVVWRIATAATRPERNKLALWGGGGIAGASTAVLAGQRWYYGEWLPNTYHLKIDGYSKPDVLVRGIVSFGKVAPVVVCVALAVAVARSSRNAAARQLTEAAASVVVASSLYSVWVGGDAWEAFLLFSRYVSVTLPAAVVAVAVAAGVSVTDRPFSRRRLWWLAAIPTAAIAAGLVSNPYRFHVRYAVLMVIMAGTLAIIARWLLGSPRHLGSRHSMVVAGLCCSFVVAASSSYPLASWVIDGGLHISDDQQKVAQGEALASVTDPGAVIATSWAGAPAYYAERPMIDLLGKSDPVIAEAATRGDFYPGHNKWDYEYSIGTLRPDVVFQEWTPDDPRTVELANWGYERRCFELPNGELTPSYFRTDSPFIHWSPLVDCG